jgi:hypothetical protein
VGYLRRCRPWGGQIHVRHRRNERLVGLKERNVRVDECQVHGDSQHGSENKVEISRDKCQCAFVNLLRLMRYACLCHMQLGQYVPASELGWNPLVWGVLCGVGRDHRKSDCAL